MATPWLSARWPAPANVRAFTTVRHGLGVSAAPFDHFNLGNRGGDHGDDPAAVDRNRALLHEHAGLPAAPRWLRQVHGAGVVRFDGEASSGARASTVAVDAPSSDGAAPWPEADAAVTATPGTVLAILTADCLPVLLCAEHGREVAGAHAGWRGLAGGVLEATVASMQAPASTLHAWLGPAAGPQHYEIGVEVYDAFVAQDWAAGAAFTSTRPHHWRVDLYALARQRLQRAGLDPARIHGGDLCTIADPRFYSHRRDRRTGRMASLIWFQ